MDKSKTRRLVRWTQASLIGALSLGWMWLGSVPSGHKWG